MPTDFQFHVLAKVRRAGVRGSAALYLSRRDATRVLDGLQVMNSALNTPEGIAAYEGTADYEGELRYKLDERLPTGLGAIEQDGQRQFISLVDVTPAPRADIQP